MPVTEVRAWRTSDGRLFESADEANLAELRAILNGTDDPVEALKANADGALEALAALTKRVVKKG